MLLGAESGVCVRLGTGSTSMCLSPFFPRILCDLKERPGLVLVLQGKREEANDPKEYWTPRRVAGV